MNDEGIGIAGWLLADLVLVLAVVFLAIVPGTPPLEAESPTPTVTPRATSTLPPPPPPEPPDCQPQTDFRFDQIVVEEIVPGQVTWEAIADGRVRRGLTKDLETEEFDTDEHPRGEALEFLIERLRDEYRIALVETFGWAPRPDASLAREVNAAFREGVSSDSTPLSDDLFLRSTETHAEWTASYWFSDAYARDSARINLYFVKALPSEC